MIGVQDTSQWSDMPRERVGTVGVVGDLASAEIVFIHGVGLRSEAWAHQLSALGTDFNVAAVDLAGHGESQRLEDATCVADLTDAIGTVLPEGCIVVGHSLGAMIAVDLAARYGAKLRGFIAMNGIFERSAEASAAVQARAAALDVNGATDPTPTLDRWFADGYPVERAACARWLTNVDPKAYKTAYTIFANTDGPSRGALASVDCPALFLTGADEPMSTPPMSRAMAQICKGATAQVIAGAAHMMPMTHAEDVNKALIYFASRWLGP